MPALSVMDPHGAQPQDEIPAPASPSSVPVQDGDTESLHIVPSSPRPAPDHLCADQEEVKNELAQIIDFIESARASSSNLEHSLPAHSPPETSVVEIKAQAIQLIAEAFSEAQERETKSSSSSSSDTSPLDLINLSSADLLHEQTSNSQQNVVIPSPPPNASESNENDRAKSSKAGKGKGKRKRSKNSSVSPRPAFQKRLLRSSSALSELVSSSSSISLSSSRLRGRRSPQKPPSNQVSE